MPLVVAAASIGLFHTLLGSDHYLPFVAMSKSGRWSMRKTAVITALCGLGHVAGSVVLGVLGIAIGAAVGTLEFVESIRGDLAAWGLTAFGLIYFVLGVRKALRDRPHQHDHAHSVSHRHVHTHTHSDDHLHAHGTEAVGGSTPWVLFAIFLFGPCEPLIPLLMYPAAQGSAYGVVAVALVFAVTTVVTMLAVVLGVVSSVRPVEVGRMSRYTHAIAGGTVCKCGVSIQLLGL